MPSDSLRKVTWCQLKQSPLPAPSCLPSPPPSPPLWASAAPSHTLVLSGHTPWRSLLLFLQFYQPGAPHPRVSLSFPFPNAGALWGLVVFSGPSTAPVLPPGSPWAAGWLWWVVIGVSLFGAQPPPSQSDVTAKKHRASTLGASVLPFPTHPPVQRLGLMSCAAFGRTKPINSVHSTGLSSPSSHVSVVVRAARCPHGCVGRCCGYRWMWLFSELEVGRKLGFSAPPPTDLPSLPAAQCCVGSPRPRPTGLGHVLGSTFLPFPCAAPLPR